MEEGKKLSVEYCKKKLNRNGNNYTDEEVRKIRDFLYNLAEIAVNNYRKKNKR